MSKFLEDIDGCVKQYRCVLAIYLITVLSSSCGIIMDRAINAPGHVHNFVYGIMQRQKLFEGENGTYR